MGFLIFHKSPIVLDQPHQDFLAHPLLTWVLNNKRWIDNKVVDKCLDVFKIYRHTRHWKKDEPAFNVVLKDKWLQLDESWNYFPRDKYKKVHMIHYYGQRFTQKPKHSAF